MNENTKQQTKQNENFIQWIASSYKTTPDVISECLEIYFKRTKNRTHFQELDYIIQKKIQNLPESKKN